MSPSSTSRSQLTVGAVLAGLQIVAGATALSDITSPILHGWVIVGIAAIQAGWAYYLQGATTPTEHVAAIELDTGTVAGPAAEPTTGTPVEVLPTDGD